MQMVSCSVGDDSSWKESKMFNVNFSYLGLRLKKKKKTESYFLFSNYYENDPWILFFIFWLFQ